MSALVFEGVLIGEDSGVIVGGKIRVLDGDSVEIFDGINYGVEEIDVLDLRWWSRERISLLVERISWFVERISTLIALDDCWSR